jgi:alpha-mannosidase
MSIVLDALPATPLLGEKEARPLLRFDTQIDWWEKHRFLRFEVPTRLRSDSASFETQFGITKRPTTRNTSWEAAKFEVCGHRFADLSEEDYGLSILTESKYGYSVEGGLMRLSLLKAGTYPDAHEDEGLHQFAFALYPHVGGVGKGKVVQVARVFNARFDVDYGRQSNVDIATLERSTGTASSDLQMPIELVDGTQGGVVIDTIKRAEDDFEYYGQKPKDSKSFGIVVRLYESLGAHAKPTIKISVPVKATALTNLLEDVDDKSSEELAFNTYADEKDHTYVQLDFRPFEIKTLKISL